MLPYFKGNRKKVLVGLILLASLVGMLFWVTDSSLVTRYYDIASEQVVSPIKLAVVTDLHSCDYGNNQEELIQVINAAEPDAVVMIGDIVDDVLDRDKAMEFFKEVSGQYPCYYVSGNHEYWSGDIHQIKKMIQSYGIDVLEGDSVELSFGEQVIVLCGIDDPEVGNVQWHKQLKTAMLDSDENKFIVLLSHRPEPVEAYLDYPIDLVLAGHAHGGQWRLPGLINGLVAPDQGLFPAYAGGRYDLGHLTMIVSRGLAKESTRIPRIFNHRELVVVTIN